MATRLGNRVALNASRDGAMQALFAKELHLVRTIENNLTAHPPEPEELRTDFRTLSVGYRSLLGQVMKLTSISDATQLQLKRTQESLSIALKKVERLNKNLQTLNEEKDEILALAAHDLRSPLSGISGLADLLAEGQAANEAEGREFAQEIATLADDTLEMIRNLLDIYQLDQTPGTLTETLQPIQIADLIQAIRDFSRPNALRKNIEVLAHSESAAQRVLIDVPLFLRVAENLVSNALKYSPPGKRISIRLEAEKSFLLLTVSDNGPGISESDQTKLFRKFSKLSSQPTGGESAVGLGLAIVHRILLHLGGTIQCESRLGEGTTFTACFPASLTSQV